MRIWGQIENAENKYDKNIFNYLSADNKKCDNVTLTTHLLHYVSFSKLGRDLFLNKMSLIWIFLFSISNEIL